MPGPTIPRRSSRRWPPSAWGAAAPRSASRPAELANVVACVDVKRGKAEKFAGALGGKCEVYTDYRKVLDRKDVQAVACATPDHWHAKIAIEAMRAGKDVYCEKPLTLTIAEGKLICKVVRETGRVFQVGTQQRSEYHSAFLEAAAIARSGRLGKKLHAMATVEKAEAGGPFRAEPTPADLNGTFGWARPPRSPTRRSAAAYEFRYWLEYSGGEVTDWGVHHTDIALWAPGRRGDRGIEVEGKGEFPLGRELMLADACWARSPSRPCRPATTCATTYNCTMTLPNGNSIDADQRRHTTCSSRASGAIWPSAAAASAASSSRS